jgi:hypothetical protein
VARGEIKRLAVFMLERRAIERHAYTHREQFPSRGDKAVRAQSMRGRMAMLGLYVRQGAPWFADLRAELLSFPAGRHDDRVDALGLVGQLLDKINAGQKPKPLEGAYLVEFRAAPTLKTDGPSTRPAECCPA